jgi:hypothetical protein
MLVCMFNFYSSLEKCNAEKGCKLRSTRKSSVIPGAHEKETIKNFVHPYPEPRKVSWLSRLRRNR